MQKGTTKQPVKKTVQQVINDIWWAHTLPWVLIVLAAIQLGLGFYWIGLIDPIFKITIIFSMVGNVFVFLSIMGINFAVLYYTATFTHPITVALLGNEREDVSKESKVNKEQIVEKSDDLISKDGAPATRKRKARKDQ